MTGYDLIGNSMDGCGCQSMGQTNTTQFIDEIIGVDTNGENKPLFTVDVSFPRNELIKAGTTIAVAVLAANFISKQF